MGLGLNSFARTWLGLNSFVRMVRGVDRVACMALCLNSDDV